MTIIFLFAAVSCSVPYSTTTTCDIIWMNDQGNEVARWEKSIIDMAQAAHRQPVVGFTSGGTRRVISGGMILIDNVEVSHTVHDSGSHTGVHNMSGVCSSYDILKFICEDIGIPDIGDIMNDSLDEIYSKAGRRLDMNRFISKFNKRFMITQIDYNHIPVPGSTIHDLHEIIKYHHRFVQR